MNSSVKASSLKPQEELMLQPESEGRERPMSQLKGSQEEEVPLTQEKVSLFVLVMPSTDWMRSTYPP